MNDEELMTFRSDRHYRSRPMRGAKQIDRDVRHGSRGGSRGGDTLLPLYPLFPIQVGPSYR